MVDMARFLLDFFVEESCGKCTPCRDGGAQMLRILDRICTGEGLIGDLSLLEKLGRTMIDASVCGLGSMAPNPVLAGLKYFRNEFEAHIREGKCEAGVCRMPDPVKESLSIEADHD
jgi:NADH:ubiquinone oxidoreductase subunit F (NADH-binding)